MTPSPDALALYQRELCDANAPVEPIICVELAAAPGDQIAAITVRVPRSVLAGRAGDQPIMTLATRRRPASERFAPAITRVGASGAATTASCCRRPDAVSGMHLEIDCPITSPDEDLTITMLAWEVVDVLVGDAPYVRACLDGVVAFPALPDAPVVMTVVTSEDATPRCIQGTHVLAYPSRTHAGERYLSIHFRPDRPVRIRAEFGPTNAVTDIWASFARLAAAMTLVALVTSLTRAADSTGRVLAVLTSLVALATVAGAVLRQLAELRIYGDVRRRLQGTLLALQTLCLAVMAASLLRLRSGDPGGLYDVVEPAAIVLAALAAAASAGGLALHRLGVWHRFGCDAEDCTNVLSPRLGRRECRYTGRVMCNTHIETICRSCVHFPDLQPPPSRRRPSPPSTTAQLFDHRLLPCRQPPGTGG